MSQTIYSRRRQQMLACCCTLLLLLCLSPGASPRVFAQTSNNDRDRAMQLFEQNKFAEAIPLLEKLAQADSSDIVVMERLGWAMLVVAMSLKDPKARQQGRERARKALQRAQELGDNSELLQIGLDVLSKPDPADVPFSANKEADAAMRTGEEAHSRGDLDKAIKAYQRALELDPKLYMAALFTGDMYFKKGYQENEPTARKNYLDKAGEWFARAIAIEPAVETAHRYWGDALMAQGKMTEARDKFIEGIIAEPYNRKAYIGLMQWSERNNIAMGHPKIEQPQPGAKSSVEKDKTTTTTTPNSQQGSAYYWSFYDQTRSAYPTASFAKDHPGEKAYRHSLKEEAAALKMVAEMASKDLKAGKIKSLDDSLSNLVRLNEAGLIEAYVLFVRPDDGIAQDYAAYRQSNINLLRRYWTDVVIAPGGN
ncbi:MAG TPA: tetratricopeptide repeat protein [Pyrinomonadaceae bacterium]